MLSYHYTARDPATGQYTKADVEADNEQAAAKLIRAEGLVPINIELSDKRIASGRRRRRVKIKDKVLFSRQLSTLINAGLPLVQSLRTVNAQSTSKPLKVVINQVISDVEGGLTLSVAMSKHPEAFDQVYISLIAAGEASGTLDKALERLAIQQEKDADLISKLRGAMIYPIIVLLVMVGVVGFMIVKVLPQVKTLYDGISGGTLPRPIAAITAPHDGSRTASSSRESDPATAKKTSIGVAGFAGTIAAGGSGSSRTKTTSPSSR